MVLIPSATSACDRPRSKRKAVRASPIAWLNSSRLLISPRFQFTELSFRTKSQSCVEVLHQLGITLERHRPVTNQVNTCFPGPCVGSRNHQLPRALSTDAVYGSDGSLRFAVINELHKHPVCPRELLPSLRRGFRRAVGTETEARSFAREYVCILLTDDGHGRGVRGNSIGWQPRNPRVLPPVPVGSIPDPLHRIFVRQT